MNKKIIAGVLSALLLTTSISVFAEGVENFNWNNPPMQFTDVPSHQWYYNDVSMASASGIINGIGNNQFNPNGTLTHAAAMTLMAKVHAIYLYGNSDIINEYQKTDDHWASGIHSYCLDHRLPTPTEAEFDTNISRGTMARYFRNSLPSKAFDTGISNDLSLMPEQTTNTIVQDLFRAGILIGDNNGFRLEDSITRAEAAAIIHRVANPDVRVKVTPPAQPQQPVTPQQPGQTSYELRYLNIPHTRWNGDSSVSGNFSIQGQNGYINTKFGNHSYGCANQQEYDAVMKAVEEAYQYAIKTEANKSYIRRGIKGIEDVYGRETDRTYIFLKDRVGLGTKDRVISWRVTQSIVGYMDSYLKDNYAAKSGVPHVTDGKDNNVYKYLFGSGQLDCDGSANLYMLCYDYLGFSTRTIGSYNVSHQVAEVYVNGHWILINQDTGGIDDITHAELMQMISSGSDCGIKTGSKDMIVLTAKNGKGSQLSDLAVDNTPTHAPNDRSL